MQLLLRLYLLMGILPMLRFRTLGSDLGSAVKGFRSAMGDAEEAKKELADDTSEDASFENTPVEEPRKDA